jgi:hypothetical protein
MNDILGRPIQVGDTILTNHPHTASFGKLTKVLRVNKHTITHATTRRVFDKATRKYNKVEGTIRKRSYQVLVVNDQIEANRTKFPEAFL